MIHRLILCTQSAPPTTAEPVNSGGQPGKSVTFAEHDAQPQPQPQPPSGPHAVIANAVVEHSNGEISASYRLFDYQGHEMAPEGQVPEETNYVPSQFDPSRPQGPAMFNIALGDVGTLPDGRNLLKRKALNHLGEYMYPEGKPLRQHLSHAHVTAAVGANREAPDRDSHGCEPGESSDDGRGSSPPVMTIDLPLNFRPLHSSLRTRRGVVVPRTPTYLEHPESFFVTMMKRAGLAPTPIYEFLLFLNTHDLHHNDFWDELGEKRMKNGELKSARETAGDLLSYLTCIVLQKRRYHPQHRPRPDRDLCFGYAGDNFIFGRLRRDWRVPAEIVFIIDCAPTTVGQDKQDSPPTQVSPSRLLAAAAKQFARNGSITHIYGMTYFDTTAVLYYIDHCGYLHSNPLDLNPKDDMVFNEDDLSDVDGIAQFTSIILSMCYMTDEDLGFNPLFELPRTVRPRKDLAGIHVTFDSTDGRKYVINKAISCSRSLFGLGSALYWAHKATDTPSAEKDESGLPRSTHTLRLQWHSRPWTSTQPLYGLAEACGVDNLAAVEEAAFGQCIGDGFRSTTLEFERRFAADVRPRMLSMKPPCMSLSSVTDPGQFKAAFISLVRAHRDLYIKAGILHRDVSPHSMVVDASNPSRGIIAGLDLALHVTALPSWEDEILPLGDSAFQSIDLGQLPVGEPPPEQRYRYDLESFFFLLIWSACKLAASVPYEERWHGIDVGQTVLSLVFGEEGEGEMEPAPDFRAGEMIPEGGVGEWRSDADIQELKTRLVLLDQYALEDGDDDDGDDFNAKPAIAKGSLLPSLSTTRLNDRMHDRMLLSSLEQLPYGFGRYWILPLQELFRDGYTSRRIWCERKAAAAAASVFPEGEPGHGCGTGRELGSNEMRSAVLSHVGEFDGDTLGGHVTYDKFIWILEKGSAEIGKETSSLS